MGLIELILNRCGYYKNQPFGVGRALDELEAMKSAAKYVESSGFRVFNYAPGIHVEDSKLAGCLEFIGKRGYLAVESSNLFGVVSPLFDNSEEIAKQRRATFKLVSESD